VRVSVRHTHQKVPVFSQRCGRIFAGRNLALLPVGSLSKMAHIQMWGGQLQETAALISPYLPPSIMPSSRTTGIYPI
jgi:hypothetical protein